MIDRASLRMSAVLLLAGQVLYIVVTQFHAGGDANNHPAVFAAYAGSGIWKAVHVGQFMCAAILLAGLVVLPFAVNGQAGSARWVGRFGAALAVVALALYGVLQAVDGVGNQEVDDAWINAPNAEKAARFASAEAMRWLEWGARSYHDFALGLALLLIAAAIVGAARIPRPIAYLIGALWPQLPGAGVGGRLRRLLGNAHHPDSGGLGPHPCVDDLAGCRRLAHARFGREPHPLGGARWEGGVCP